MTDEQLRERGLKAKALLEDELLLEAMEAIKAEAIRQWCEAPARDVEGRERLWLMVKITEKFEANLHTHIAKGEFASAKLAKIEEKSRLRQMMGK